jgi:phospho-N-acetylmuramoyl-pentapeptide-transferase
VVALLIAASVGLLVTLVGTPVLIRAFQARGIGQQIRDDGPAGHATKAGTPTMGGVMVVLAAALGYAIAHLPRVFTDRGATFTAAGFLVLMAIVGSGLVGVVDDWISVRHQRSLGLNKRTKLFGQLLVAVTFALLAIYRANVLVELSFTRTLNLELSVGAYILWAVVIIIGTSNAVNLTDGLDGLAAGSSVFAFAAFVFIGFWEFRHPEVYGLGPGLDLALVAAAMAGACTGFLWWNAAPARVFMGDTGALAMGAGLGALALATNTQLLLPVVGGLFVMVTLSVVIQVFAFRVFHRRVFRMAPIHHHFELGGWPETTVIVRFWILSGLCTALAIGIFYADFLTTGAAD